MGFSAKTQVTLPFVSNLWDLKPAVAAPPPGPKPTLVLVESQKWQENFLPEMYRFSGCFFSCFRCVDFTTSEICTRGYK